MLYVPRRSGWLTRTLDAALDSNPTLTAKATTRLAATGPGRGLIIQAMAIVSSMEERRKQAESPQPGPTDATSSNGRRPDSGGIDNSSMASPPRKPS
jgi:hypothetical protein